MRNIPRPVCAAACRTLERITWSLQVGDERTLVESSNVHMPVRVRRLDDVAPGSLFLVGHYHESTVGTAHTLVADPEVVFLRADSGDWVSLSFRAPFAHVATVDVGDSIRLLRAAEHATLVKLVEVWLRNVEVNLLHGGGLEEEINHPASYAAE